MAIQSMEYYANILKQLKNYEEQTPKKTNESGIFQGDNSPARKIILSMASLRDYGF